VEAVAKLPAIQRRSLVQRPDLVFQKRQVMQRVVDKISNTGKTWGKADFFSCADASSSDSSYV
jgi:hypothetical protein